MSYRIGTSLAIVTAAAFIGTSAFGADLRPAYKAPMAVPAPVFSWTGFYIGAHGGAGWGTGETTIDTFNGAVIAFPPFQTQVNGFLGGGQVGYNWQVNPSFVVGLEGDFSWTNIKGNTTCVFVFNCGGEVNWLADITGRAGIAVGQALVYVKGGAVWANTDYTFAPGFNIPLAATKTTETRVGALLGVGTEYAVSRNWSAKIEYNYTDFGKQSVGFVNPLGPGTAATSTIDQHIHLMKAGVNYRF